MIKNNISITSDFLNLLSECHGEEVSGWFEELWKARYSKILVDLLEKNLVYHRKENNNKNIAFFL